MSLLKPSNILFGGFVIKIA